MVSLSKKEILEEIAAITEVIKAHEDQMKLHVKGIKVMTFNKELFEKELKKL